MAEYKDVELLKKQIADFKRAVKSGNCDYLIGYISALSTVEGMIAEQPTIEIVRCKDCKHAYINSFPTLSGVVFCKLLANKSEGAAYTMQQNDFCSYGERRNDNG